jgi:hypothetical protein
MSPCSGHSAGSACPAKPACPSMYTCTGDGAGCWQPKQQVDGACQLGGDHSLLDSTCDAVWCQPLYGKDRQSIEQGSIIALIDIVIVRASNQAGRSAWLCFTVRTFSDLFADPYARTWQMGANASSARCWRLASFHSQVNIVYVTVSLPLLHHTYIFCSQYASMQCMALACARLIAGTDCCRMTIGGASLSWLVDGGWWRMHNYVSITRSCWCIMQCKAGAEWRRFHPPFV